MTRSILSRVGAGHGEDLLDGTLVFSQDVAAAAGIRADSPGHRTRSPEADARRVLSAPASRMQ